MNIVFVLNVAFPYGQAFSSRARYITMLLCECGYHVHVIAPKQKKEQPCPELENIDCTIEYVTPPNSKLALAGIGAAKPYTDALENYLAKNSVAAVFSASMPFVAEKIRKITKAKNIPYAVEQCEWYDKSTFTGGSLNPYYRKHIQRILKGNKSCDGVLSISRLFHEHYTAQGVASLRMPTILDIENTQCALEHDREKINIVFAGSLGKGKENIAPILEAISLLGEDAQKLHFNIYGANNAQVLENVGGNQALMDKVAPYVTAHGRIPQQEVEGKLRDADFSIFMRPDRQSSHAGFPTKLAESMAVGTPVIANDTGDIGLYLKTDETGYLLQSGEAEELAEVLRKILQTTAQQRSAMRQTTRTEALRSFDYRVYQDGMKELLDKMR